jgi:putative membrane protein
MFVRLSWAGGALRRPMNAGPRPTDVLANERTFLAYLRTALSFIALGFVIARFALFNEELALVMHAAEKTHRFSNGFGTVVALFGAFIAAYGGLRYVATDRALASDRAVSLSPVIAATGAAVVALVGVAVGVGLVALH